MIDIIVCDGRLLHLVDNIWFYLVLKCKYGHINFCWKSGWSSRPRGRVFETHRRHCVVSLIKNFNTSLVLVQRERSGSVVECLTRDRRAAGSSLTASMRCGP